MARIRRPYTRIIVTWVVICVVFVSALIVFGVLAWKNTHWTDTAAVPAGTLTLTSPAFTNNGTMPQQYTADGANISPPLQWQGAPKGTGSFAVIVEDRDAPSGSFTHWLIADISSKATGLPEGVSRQDMVNVPLPAVQGLNTFKEVGYKGPDPPPGKVHHYDFYLFALDGRLDMPGSFSKAQLRAAMAGRELAETTLVGCYERKR
jgi:Raf kinase inhibitor-like YbhB/YbcL family protein